MNDLDMENKRWLARMLENVSRGDKGEIALKAGIDGTKLSRMANIDPKADPKNTQRIPLPVLHRLRDIFQSDPPGLPAGREAPFPHLVQVRILDKVPAGKLKQSLSQAPPEDAPKMIFADLGKGDFFALTVDGDSMDRIAPDGSKIVVDQSDRELVSGKPYVFSDRGQASFKLWRANPPRWAPYSTNPAHEAHYVKSKEAAERMVVGRVKRAVIDL